MQAIDHITIQCDTGSYIPINKGMYYISNESDEDAFVMNKPVKVCGKIFNLKYDSM